MWENDSPGKRASKKRSSRMPFSSPVTVTVCTPFGIGRWHGRHGGLFPSAFSPSAFSTWAAGRSSKVRIRRSCGKRNIQSATIANRPTPPISTAGTAPMARRHRAGAEIAEIVRGAGEHAVNRADPAAHLRRRAQLHQREADHHADHVGGSHHRQRGQRQDEMGREREHDDRRTEDRRSPQNSTWPIGSVSGRRASTTDIAKAPTPGAARSSPSPHGPVSRMSRAKTGNSAGAPARNTAHMSSEMVPRITRSRADELEAAQQRLEAHRLARARHASPCGSGR